MQQGKTVIGQAVVAPEAESGLHAVGRQYRMQRTEGQPRQAVPDVFGRDGILSRQEAFIRAMVAVVLKPGTMSARMTFPP